MIFSVTNSNYLCSLSIVYHGVVSPTLDVNPTLFVNLCEKIWGTMNLKWYNYGHKPRDFSSQLQSSMTIFHHKLLIREGKVLATGLAHP